MSDTSDRNFVLIMFIILYIYMLNTQSRISVKNDWNNTKCNPLNLFTSSFYQSEQESYNQFGNCIKQFSKGIASSEMSDIVNKQKDEFEKVSILATNNMVDISKNITYQANKIDENYKKTNEKIDNTNKSLNTLSNYVPNLYDKLEIFKNDVKTIFSNISSYVNK